MLIGISPAKNGSKSFMQDTLAFEKFVSVSHDVINYFSGFDSRSNMCEPYFYKRAMDIAAVNKIPMITFYPSTSTMYPTPLDMCDRITSGEFDSYLSDVVSNLSKYLKDSGSMVYFRFAHEMNISTRVYSDPLKFISMWKYVYKFFRSKGLGKDKVPFIWCPSCIDLGTPKFENYYPGDDFVEFLGVDGYNWGGRGAWQSLSEVFTDSFTRLNSLSTLPLIVCEFGTTAKLGTVYDYDKKLSWVSEGYKWLSSIQSKHKIKMVCYFNVNNGASDIDSAVFEPKSIVFNETLLNFVYTAPNGDQYKTLESLRGSYCSSLRLLEDYVEILYTL